MDARTTELMTATSSNRVAILRAVAAQRQSVKELCETVGRPQPLVSQDLSVLRMRGFVESRVDGSYRIYSITKAGRRVLALANRAAV